MYMVDYHLHSIRSNDGKDSLDAICECAIENGISEIAVTDHFEPRPNENSHLKYDPFMSWLEVKYMNLKYAGRLVVRTGVELGQPHLFSKESKQIVESAPYDYVLASVHYTMLLGDVGLEIANGCDEDKMVEAYLNELDAMIGFNDFDCIGHFELPLRYFSMYYQREILLEKHFEQVRHILRKIILSGKGIEINTSGYRIPSLNRSLISNSLLMLYKELGGEIITIGSDAHSKEFVGFKVKETMQNLEQLGFDYVTTFEERTPVRLSLKTGDRKRKLKYAI